MKEFKQDRSPGAFAVSVTCLHCGRMLRLADALIDPTGPAFKAYYHESPPCAREAFGTYGVETIGKGN